VTAFLSAGAKVAGWWPCAPDAAGGAGPAAPLLAGLEWASLSRILILLSVLTMTLANWRLKAGVAQTAAGLFKHLAQRVCAAGLDRRQFQRRFGRGALRAGLCRDELLRLWAGRRDGKRPPETLKGKNL